MLNQVVNPEKILQLLKLKDNEAFRYLYRRYFGALSALAEYYVKDRLVAEDLVQEVFIVLLDRKKEFNSLTEVKYFLYVSLKNACISYFRRQKLADKYSQEVLASCEEEVAFWDQVQKEDVYALLLTAIQQLPPQCRQVMLYSLDGLKLAEIAERMQISFETVKEYKHNGKKKLLKLLQNQEFVLCLQFFLL